MTATHFQSAGQMADAIQRGDISASELLEHFLERVEQHNAPINAIVVLDAERAREQARRADEATARGERFGPLHGVPITVKEAFDVEGLATTQGFPKHANNIAAEDSIPVRRLKQAGAIVFGKTNVPVALADWQTFNPVYGTTNNPWDHSRTPGGSSGGSAAALAAGLTGLELGSDIGASIRNPAHFCGIFGHKPTFGICSFKGHWIPPWESTPELDINVIGPMARSAADLATALDILSGPDDIDSVGWKVELPRANQTSVSEFRVAVVYSDPVAEVDDEVQNALRELTRVLRESGAQVDEGARPEIDSAHSHDVYIGLLRAATSQYMADEDFADHLARVTDISESDSSYPAKMYRATTMGHRHWLALNEQRYRLRHQWAKFFDNYDVLLCPAATTVAFAQNHHGERWERMVDVNGNPQPTTTPLFWAGYSGSVYLPSTVAPLPAGPSGLPTGVQIVAPQYQDHRSIRFASLIEDLTGGFKAPPGY